MEKKGQTITIIAIIGIIIILGLIIWQVIPIINKPPINTTEQEGSLNESEVNATSQKETNETNGEANETGQPENNTSNILLNPTGSITSISYRDDEIGGYFCNNTINYTVNPEHKIKLYTYKIINGIKNLSENYIESEKINNVCDAYGNVSINYYIKWKWDAVEGIEGYRVYQHYYLNVNFSRSYSHYIDLKTEKLIDTGTDLWMRET